MEINLDQWEREYDLQALDAYRQGKADAPTIYKAVSDVRAIEHDGPIVVVASHESEDRMGDVILIGGWDLTMFRKNPVLLLSHDPTVPPVGRVPKINPEGKELIAAIEFDLHDRMGAELDGKFRRGFMRATSVGFRPLEFEPRQNGGILFTSHELLELSVVSVPAHPRALMKMMALKKFQVTMPDTKANAKDRDKLRQAVGLIFEVMGEVQHDDGKQAPVTTPEPMPDLPTPEEPKYEQLMGLLSDFTRFTRELTATNQED